MRRVGLIAVTIFIVACHRPALRVTQHGSSITVDAQTLGEYPSDVARLRLTDASTHRVVWEVKGHDDPQLGKVVLKVGENPVVVGDTRHGTYDVVAPIGKQTFTLAGGGKYIIEAWGRDGNPNTKRETEFTTPRS
jgi:hypothetical protein